MASAVNREIFEFVERALSVKSRVLEAAVIPIFWVFTSCAAIGRETVR